MVEVCWIEDSNFEDNDFEDNCKKVPDILTFWKNTIQIIYKKRFFFKKQWITVSMFLHVPYYPKLSKSFMVLLQIFLKVFLSHS